MSNRRQIVIFLIFCLALAVRIIFCALDTEPPASDAVGYDELGWTVAQGKGYIDEDGTPHSYRPPLYPFFLSLIYSLFGHSYLAVKIVQSAIGAVNCIIIYYIARRFLEHKWSAIAALISALYFPFIKSGTILLTEHFFGFFLLLIVVYLFKIRDNATVINSAILGLLLGLSCLIKGVMILFIVFIPLLFLWQKNMKKYIVTALFFILALLPWTIRNYMIFDRIIPVSTQGGISFYSSYFPKDGILGFNASLEDPIVIESHRIDSPAERSNFLVKKTVEFIFTNPSQVLKLAIKKTLYFWAPFDWEIVGGRWFNLIYAVLFPFFLIGVFFSLRDIRKFGPILLPLVYFQVITLIFYGSPRFRLPLEPFIFLIAISGILQIKKVLNNAVFTKK